MKKIFASPLWKPFLVTRSTTLSLDTLEVKKETLNIDGNYKSILFYNALGLGVIGIECVCKYFFN